MADPEEASAILAAYGIPIVANYIAGDPDQAASVAAKIGFPVVLKIRSPDITHKSDVGGVALNLGHAERVRQEAVAMLERVRTACSTARLDGFLLQPMVSRHGAAELLVGLSEDPIFGPLVAFGQGGTAVEVVYDTSLELPPLNGLLARRLMVRTRVWQLLQGYRPASLAELHISRAFSIRRRRTADPLQHLQPRAPKMPDMKGAGRGADTVVRFVNHPRRRQRSHRHADDVERPARPVT